MASHSTIENITRDGLRFVKKEVSVRQGLSYRVMHFIEGKIVSAKDYDVRMMQAVERTTAT